LLGQVLPAVVAAALATPAAYGSQPVNTPAAHRILIVQSFGSDFAPYSDLASSFRSELAAALAAPATFLEVTIGTDPASDSLREDALVDYINALDAGRRIDLVVPVGGPASLFVVAQRERLSLTAPVLHAGANSRLVPAEKLGNRDAAVLSEFDPSIAVDNILAVLPDTERVAIVIGRTPLEHYWRSEIERDLRRFEDRLTLLWWDELPFSEVVRLAAELPPRSAILHTILMVDAAGTTHTHESVLETLHAHVRTPIFGLFDNQLGRGVVGGRMIPIAEIGHRSTAVAVAMLRGEAPAAAGAAPVPPSPPVFDWRELRRWGIREAALPPGASVRFRPPPLWVEYRWAVIGILTTVLLQTALVLALLAQRSRLRVAQDEVCQLSRRLLTAFEEERSRVARDLHDDLAQRLARLAIDVARIERGGSAAGGAATTHPIGDEIVRLSSDVHTLSHQLHPSLLDNLGLAEALRAEAEQFATAESIAVDPSVDELRDEPPPDVALCLYRVAQEALRNVARHAGATRVSLALRSRQGGCELMIRDNGIGFDRGARSVGHGIGHAGMRERLSLVGGRLVIRSKAGSGTTVTAWAPTGERSR
jgi:signal transduction histidine kinase